MKNKATLLLFLLSLDVLARPAACPEYNDNKVRCLAKKRCRWLDAPGENINAGLCLFKKTPENAKEIAQYDKVTKDLEACYLLLTEYQQTRELQIRAEISNDESGSGQLKEKLVQLKEEIIKVDGCQKRAKEQAIKW
jgi:hypothetical protein